MSQNPKGIEPQTLQKTNEIQKAMMPANEPGDHIVEDHIAREINEPSIPNGDVDGNKVIYFPFFRI